jgi:hypothetical protein
MGADNSPVYVTSVRRSNINPQEKLIDNRLDKKDC